MRYLSICSGIEAATVAWHALGWMPAAFAEIDRFPSAVLAHHYPQVPNLGDFTRIEAADVGPIDLLVGGTPCQGFSVAGKRLGLDDPRSNLALDFCRLARRLRPRWVVWENVPGVHSNWSGAPDGEDLPPGGEWRGDEDSDFGAFLDTLEECGYPACWRVLDTQYVRVESHPRAAPQRRERVFVVGHLGDWRPSAAVLLEPEGLRRDPPPRREAGQRPAPSLAARTRGGGGLGTDFDLDGGLTAVEGHGLNDLGGASHSLTARHSRSGRHDPHGETYVAAPVADPLMARSSRGGSQPLSPGFQTDGLIVAHSLMGGGFDASEDGTGRGTPIIPVDITNGIIGGDVSGTLEHAQHKSNRGHGVIAFDTTQITSKANRCQPEDGGPCHPLPAHGHAPALAFSCKDYGADAQEDRSPTLRAMGHAESHPNAGGQVAVAFHARQDPDSGSVTHPLDTDGHSIGVHHGWAVRRLTPRECERLQGFPDDYTLIPYRGKPAMDGPRYKALGNSMSINCMRWIGERIALFERVACGRASA